MRNAMNKMHDLNISLPFLKLLKRCVVRVKVGLSTVKLGGGIRMCKKPSQKREKVFRDGSNFHRLKINLAISLTKRKPRELLLRQGGMRR